MTTEVSEFFAELDAGVFEGKLSRSLSDVAASCMDHGKKGQIVITLDIDRIGTSQQVGVKHKLKVSRPTVRGTSTEDDTTSTPMYIGVGGKMTLFPENQTQMFDMKGGIAEEQNQ